MSAPDRIGRYRVIGVLGQGAMGTVYHGRDESLDRDVALKVMSAGLRDENTRSRFLREARAAAKLQHPNIIVIYELGEHEGAPYMALELLKGVDLQRAIDEGIRPDPRATLPVVLQVLAGLGRAHENGIVHRDIKPSNIFLPYGLPAKIMDFGVARLAGHGQTTTSGVVVGTPNYMSPEQVRGEKIDGRSDLFSVGLILYELVTGEKAFRADTVVAVVFKILHGEVSLDLIPAGSQWERLRSVITRALAREPRERYPDAAVMAADLGRALEDLGGAVDPTAPADQALLARPRPVPAAPATAAPLPPPAPRTRRPAARRPGPSAPRRTPARRGALILAGLLVLGALALLAFAGWLVLSPGRTPWSGVRPASREPGSATPTPLPLATPTPAPTVAPTTAEQVDTETRTPEPTATSTPAATPLPTPPPTPPPTPTPAPALSVEERLLRADEWYAQGRFSKALAEARAVLQEHPTNEQATVIAQDAEAAMVVEECIDNARAALDAGDTDTALSEIRRGFAVNQNDARLMALFREATQSN
jgi:hypothetical protein